MALAYFRWNSENYTLRKETETPSLAQSKGQVPFPTAFLPPWLHDLEVSAASSLALNIPFKANAALEVSLSDNSDPKWPETSPRGQEGEWTGRGRWPPAPPPGWCPWDASLHPMNTRWSFCVCGGSGRWGLLPLPRFGPRGRRRPSSYVAQLRSCSL